MAVILLGALDCMMMLFLAWDAFVFGSIWMDHRRKKKGGESPKIPLIFVISPVRMIPFALLVGGTTSVITEGLALTLLAPALPVFLGLGVGLLRGPEWLKGRMLRMERLNKSDEGDG